MSKQSFASLIISKLSGSISTDGTSYNSGTPSKANKAIAEGITEYLLKNVKIKVSYTGIIPGPPSTPDPIKKDVLPITGKCSPPSGTDFNSWVKSIETCIMSGFFLGIGELSVSPIKSTNSFSTPGLNIPQSSLKSVHENNMNNPQQQIWEVICEGILDWLKIATVKNFGANCIPSSSTGSCSVKETLIS